MIYFLQQTMNVDRDQPLVLLTAPTGLAAFNIGGITLHSTFMFNSHNNSSEVVDLEKKSTMQIKLNNIALCVIDESARTFGERFKEHLKHPSPIYDHSNTTGHNTTLDNFSIVGREDQNLMRLIKEAIYIRVNSPSLNKNIGKCHLPHIWDEVLNNITELKLK